MKELLLILASVATRDDLVKMLKEQLEKYELNPNDEEFNNLCTIAMVIATKPACEKQSIGDLIEKMDRTEKGYELLNPKKG